MNHTQTGALTVPEFLDWARISRTKFYELVAAGQIPICKIGKKTLVRRSDAERWLENLTAAA